METIKSFTDLSQSKTLSKILPLESADMCYLQENGQAKTISPLKLSEILNVSKTQVIPCWSLAALLGVLPEKYTELIKEGGYYRIIIKDSYMTCLFDNPVDACVAMIEKLHKLNLL